MSSTQSNAKKVILLVCFGAAFCICTSLAIWQYQRSQEKLSVSEKLDRFAEKGALSWQQVKSLPKEWIDTGLQVSLSGSLAKSFWWLDNQVVNGRFGYDLIVAVRPLSSTRWWLVNLGWFAGDLQRKQLPNVTLPSNIDVSGILKVDNFKGFSLADGLDEIQQGNRVQFITPQLASRTLKQSVAPYILYADQNTALGQYHYKAINMSPDKHLAYALQWLLLALAALIIGIVLYRKGVNND